MEVVTTNGAPFHDHDVREWSRMDSLTGVLERARLETDHWTSNTNNSRQKYGKVVDSRARTDADGSLQQQARRQLEVYQSQIPGGQLQVIKTHTVSSSRWSPNNKSAEPPPLQSDFENLHLSLNTLDLSSEKSKANVGRSVSRRPPSRSRSKTDIQPAITFPSSSSSSEVTKSTSSEDLSNKSTEDLEDLEELQNWRRTSKLRRSLQYPSENKSPSTRPPDLPENIGTVRKIREELEKGRRLNTALRGNNVDLEALDQILQSLSSGEEKKSGQKRNSFVTVESLQEVRGRLRRTSEEQSARGEEEDDDGIVTENEMALKSYVYGMDKPISGTGSLESRSKTNSNGEDWHNRRKSYGFEQTPSPNTLKDNKSGKVESSTDSGICRSSEIVNFSTNVKQISSLFDRNNKDLKSTTITIPISKPWELDDKEKRHSIAVDESKYVTNQSANDKFKRTSLAILDDPSNQNRRSSKKVEFCKTEVHFAADCGKVNIVETDEKPPPTNNFRRRRRNSGPTLTDSDLPLLHFGDTNYEKALLGSGDNEEVLPNGYGNVTVNITQEDDKNVRGILKNKPMKPVPYHLGQEDGFNDSKWGVKLKPVQKPETFWKSTVTLQNTVYGEGEEHQFQKLLKNLKPTEGNGNSKDSSVKFVTGRDDNRRSWSVADRVQLTKTSDDQWTENKLYSTKVNFGDGGTTTVVQNRPQNLQKDNVIKDDSNNRIKFATTPPSELQECETIIKKSTFSRISNLKSSEKLSSPSLVGKSSTVHNGDQQNVTGTENSDHQNVTAVRRIQTRDHQIVADNIHTRDHQNVPPLTTIRDHQKVANYENVTKKDYQNVTDISLHKKHLNNDIVLRQPNKSEMTYFGVEISPKPPRKRNVGTATVIKKEKPDLLVEDVRKDDSPLYENVPKREFDSKILDELTKAADEILQAVNGLTDDDTREEIIVKKKPLDTIKESKYYRPANKVNGVKTKASSNSSLDSLGERNRMLNKPLQTQKVQRHCRGTDSSSSRASTKARRLQRASSREALLNSNGSSSEDLGVSVPPVRKPRQVRKTRTMQLTINNGIDLNKSPKAKEVHKTTRLCNRGEEKHREPNKEPPVKEIRHKTAVSTIRSVAEKSSRERSKTRINEDKRNKISSSSLHQKRDSTKSAKIETKRPINASGSTNRPVSVSTANIKKCQRTAEAGKHS